GIPCDSSLETSSSSPSSDPVSDSSSETPSMFLVSIMEPELSSATFVFVAAKRRGDGDLLSIYFSSSSTKMRGR
ncbi:hypothetical protein U1Q18_009939, partial [Sarracenia purpurea var. burkii]